MFLHRTLKTGILWRNSIMLLLALGSSSSLRATNSLASPEKQSLSFKLMISEPAFNSLVGGEENRTEPINQYAYEAQVSGTAQIHARHSLHFVPNETMAEMKVMARGNIQTWTHACRDDATIGMWSRTEFEGVKSVWWDPEGIHTQPAATRAWTQNAVTGVSVNVGFPFRRIAENIAWNRARRALAQIAADTSYQASSRINAEMDLRVGEQIKSFQQGNLTRLIPELLFLLKQEDTRSFQTNETALSISNYSYLGLEPTAEVLPPPFDSETQFGLAINDKLMPRLTAEFANREFTKEQVRIVLEKERPLSIEFRPSGIHLIVRAQQIELANIKLGAYQMEMDYQFMVPSDEITLRRLNSIEVSPVTGNSRPEQIREVRLAAEKQFTDTVMLGKLSLSGPLEKLGAVKLIQAESNQSWLTLGFK